MGENNHVDIPDEVPVNVLETLEDCPELGVSPALDEEDEEEEAGVADEDAEVAGKDEEEAD